MQTAVKSHDSRDQAIKTAEKDKTAINPRGAQAPKFTTADIDADGKFSRWLYEGSGGSMGNDVDAKLKQLVYACYRKGVSTIWSNEGRIGKTVHESFATPPEGYFIFEEGYLAYRINNEPTRKMHEIIEGIISQNPDFCRVRKGTFGEDPPTWFVMGFSDLAEKVNDPVRPRMQIEIIKPEPAEKRMTQIDQIWKHLAEEIERFDFGNHEKGES
jgi:hypothetical protein